MPPSSQRQKHADLGRYRKGEVVVKEGAHSAQVDAVERAAGHDLVDHGANALREGRVSALPRSGRRYEPRS